MPYPKTHTGTSKNLVLLCHPRASVAQTRGSATRKILGSSPRMTEQDEVFRGAHTFFLLLLAVFFFETTVKAENPKTVMNAIRLEIEKKSPLDTIRKDICAKGKICRRHNGAACESKIIFSLCWVICAQENTFPESRCVKTTAQNTLLFNLERKNFPDGKTPAQYLQAAIESSSKSPLDADLLCQGVCKIVASTKGPLFLNGIEADLKSVCAKGCQKFSAPTASPP